MGRVVKFSFAVLISGLFFTHSASSAIVTVTVIGVVEENQIGSGTLGDVNVGDTATMTFEIDSDNFTEGVR